MDDVNQEVIVIPWSPGPFRDEWDNGGYSDFWDPVERAVNQIILDPQTEGGGVKLVTPDGSGAVE